MAPAESNTLTPVYSAKQLLAFRAKARLDGLWKLSQMYDEELRQLGYED